MIDLKLKDFSRGGELMWSEKTGEILRNDSSDGTLERLCYSGYKPVIFMDFNEIELKHPKKWVWESAYIPVYGDEDKNGMTEILGYNEC
ncbi:MAG TPA: hypothetical protein DER56_06265 [Thermosipho africanus]|nr:hypothetical protein [Thermosipho africanus]